jgi:hypothetical protein
MKAIFTVLIFLISCNLLVGQGQTVWLYTPKGKKVFAETCIEHSPADIVFFTEDFQKQYTQAVLVDSASNTYNCHSYAWNMKELGPTCWLNDDPDLHWYWDDGSYELTTEANAQKICYYKNIDFLCFDF